MKLVKRVERLKKSEIGDLIKIRIKEFSGCEDLFSELCFCLMTAGFRADKCIEIQDEIGSGFFDLSLDDLSLELKRLGHRFWSQRAERIFLARGVIDELERVRREGDRDWLVREVKGMGMKEASHFLRNVGNFDFAIIDFHIVELLEREGLIEEVGSMSKKEYLEIEGILRNLARKLDLSLGELDLYLWYIETKKILK